MVDMSHGAVTDLCKTADASFDWVFRHRLGAALAIYMTCEQQHHTGKHQVACF